MGTSSATRYAASTDLLFLGGPYQKNALAHWIAVSRRESPAAGLEEMRRNGSVTVLTAELVWDAKLHQMRLETCPKVAAAVKHNLRMLREVSPAADIARKGLSIAVRELETCFDASEVKK